MNILDSKRKDNLFKSLLQSIYLRKKIFKHVEEIHRLLLGQDGYLKSQYARKSHQMITLKEFIIMNRLDLFIKHFDTVYPLMMDPLMLNDKDKDIRFSFENKRFNFLINTIFEYDNSTIFDYLLKKFGRINHSTLESFLSKRIRHLPRISRVLIRDGYHLVHKNLEDLRNPPTLIGSIIDSAIINGDFLMIDQLCNDCIDSKKGSSSTNNHPLKKVVNQINLIKKLDKETKKDSLSKYQVIFDIAKRLLECGVDIRVGIFSSVMDHDWENEKLGNQEILKWIKDSFNDKKEFEDLLDSQFSDIELFASTKTLELIEFQMPPRILNVTHHLATLAAQYGNLDFLSYVSHRLKDYNYLFKNPQLEMH
ncbi:hypothetical protein DFA_08282 [Cavenderia fasciculata]|uniref:Uncharacterized protein n=1 Tax=Cavenderia fasciculata TaxID=261658 RepID=F4Q5N0_CACFS|nr:uncharacterized protein DFA_08282 [Cavenderia fasciculata]EGG17289.1 hypothetical protein DFA_08282 [Cavenderia fasciculata]|eukprot:XP_004355773.1 hypothetical protein DFA_08282 [Cavenderia fasciculata]